MSPGTPFSTTHESMTALHIALYRYEVKRFGGAFQMSGYFVRDGILVASFGYSETETHTLPAAT